MKLLPLTTLALLILFVSAFAMKSKQVQCVNAGYTNSCNTSTPSPSGAPTGTPEAQACGRHCEQESDCRRLDPNYTCYMKTKVCRQEHNAEDESCRPAPTPAPTEEGVMSIEELRNLPSGNK